MNYALQIVSVALAVAAMTFLTGCSGESEDQPEKRVAESHESGSVMNTENDARPVEGTSFRGDPMYRLAVDPVKATKYQAMADQLEAKMQLSEDDFIQLGYQYYLLMQYRKAIDAYSRGLQQYPESFKLLRHRGHRYINVRELELAIADLQLALELYGEDREPVVEVNYNGDENGTYEHWIWYHIGLYHYLMQDFDKAAEAYTHCVETALNDTLRVGATDWLYNSYRKAGRDAEAQRAIDAIGDDVDANHEHPYFKRVMVYKGITDPATLIDIEKPAENWTGGDITTGYGVANWYAFNGDITTAQAIYDKILETPYWTAWAWTVTDREQALKH